MKTLSVFCAMVIALALTTPALAVDPPMPPATSGSGDAGMKHAGVTVTATSIGVDLAASPASPVTMTNGFGIDYTPAKFDVLEDRFFNAQHGWLPDGFISLPSDRAVWIERTAAIQPAGSTFKVYEGGNAPEGTGAWSMNEIYAADGDRWQWDGMMQHDYFTADMLGSYSMTFRVYVGDLSGIEDITYTPASTTFAMVAVPEPSTIALALLAAVGICRVSRVFPSCQRSAPCAG